MNLVKSFSSEIDKLGRRVVKFLRYGLSDVQTALEASPYGIDSNAIKDLVAVYSETSGKGNTVIIGWINKNQLAEKGELRLYSTDANGVQKFYTWLKNDGTIEIGGDSNFAVGFNELKTEFNKLKSDHDQLAEKWNSFCSNYIPGSPSVTGLPATLSTSVVAENTSDIDNAKNDKIKTI